MIEPLEARLLLDGGWIAGCVWDDLDADGVRDAGEPGLNGWTVELVSLATGQVQATATTAGADADGNGSIDPISETGLYSFTDVPAGSYRVRSRPVGDWTQTGPQIRYERTLTETDTLFAPSSLTFDFTEALPPDADGTLVVTATGDLAGADKYLQLDLEGTDLGKVFVQMGRDYAESTLSLVVLRDALNSADDDGTVSLTVTPSHAVANGPGTEQIRVELSYASFGQYTLDVADGTVAEGKDFGYAGSGMIRGAVWVDLDGDGQRDADEPGGNGWTVSVFDVATGERVATAVTADEDRNGDGTIDPQTERGLYAFEDVGRGELEVRVTGRVGWRITDPPDGRRTVSLVVTRQAEGVDFGAYLYAPIHGHYWQDTDGDGVRGADEAGLDGMAIELLNVATGQVTATAFTQSMDLDGDGAIDPSFEGGLYAFANVAPGAYRLQSPVGPGWARTAPGTDYLARFSERDTLYRPNQPAFAFAGALLPASDGLLRVTAVGDLEAADEYLTVRAEGVDLATLFVDNGRAYRATTAEVIIPQATLAELAADGTVSIRIVPSAQVDNLGGAESVEVELSYSAEGQFAVTVQSGAVLEDFDFGVFEPADIRGVTWHDLDRDGVRDADEPGHNGWTVRLVDRDTGGVLASAVSADVDLNGDGQIDPYAERGVFAFEGLGAGTFELRVVSRFGWLRTQPADGIRTVVMASGTDRTDADFGMFRLAQVRGQVWEDLDGDGVRDGGEGPLEGWTVELLDAGTGAVLASQQTRSIDLNGDGQIDPATERGVYDFQGLSAGAREVRLVNRFGWTKTAPAGTAWVLDLADGQSVEGADFALHAAPGEINGVVWLDDDGSGDRGAGEAGVDGMIVQLIDAATGQVVATTVSEGRDLDGNGVLDPFSESGHYRFPDLRYGSYEVRVNVPPQWRKAYPPAIFTAARTRTDSLYYPAALSFDFSVPSGPAGDGTLTLSAIGDLAGADQYLSVYLDGVWLADAFVAGGGAYTPADAVIAVPAGALAAAADDGTASVTIRPSAAVHNLPGSERITVELACATAGAYAVNLEPGRTVGGLQFALAPPTANEAPMLSAVQALPGGIEDQAYVITYDQLAAAADEADLEGQPISFRVESVSGGSLQKGGEAVWAGVTLIGPGTEVVWTPPAEAAGTLGAFRVRAWDGKAASALAVQVTVQVAAVNDPPTLTGIDPLTGGPENEPVAITWEMLAAASDAADVEGDPVSFRIESVPAGTATRNGQPVTPGVTVLAAGEGLTWTPPAEAFGTVQALRVVAWDGQAASAPAVPVHVEVTAVNRPPTLTSIETLTGAAEDVPYTITYASLLAASDAADPAGGPLSFRIESITAGSATKGGQPVAPGVTLLGPGESIVWLAPANQHGLMEAVRVVAASGELASAPPVPVRIDVAPVNDAPSAVDDQAATPEETPVGIDVLANDFDLEGDPLAVSGFSPPLHGKAVDNGDGTFTYTPHVDFAGLDTFTYTLDDGAGGSDVGVVTVTVAGTNDPPDALDDTAAAVEDTPAVTPSVLANDTDADGNTLLVVSFTQPAHGTAAYNGDGVFTYTPAANYHGPDSFTYTLSDGAGGQDTATVHVAVASVNDPPAAADDAAETLAGLPVVTPDVLANDTDVDGDALSVPAFDQPACGSVVYNGDGTFTYTPKPGFAGEDRFAYTVFDGAGGADTAEVVVTVTAIDNPPVNCPPVAADDSAQTAAGAAVVTPDVLANDTDDDGDALSVTGFAQPGHGSASYNGDGTFTYTPAPGFAGADAFTYTVGDGAGGKDTATVRVQVLAPAAETTPVTVGGDGARKVVLSYVDADGTAVRVELAGGGSIEGRFAGSNVAWQDARDGAAVTGEGLQLRELILTGTTPGSSLTIKTDRGGDGLAEVGGIEVEGTVKALTARTCRLSGTIHIGPRAEGDARTAVKIILGAVADATLVSLAPIQSLAVAGWLDADGAPDRVEAPWIGKLTAKGSARSGGDGRFQADLLLEGIGAPRQTLGSVQIAGDLTARSWDVAGEIGKLMVAGTAAAPAGQRCAIRSTGGIASITVGAVEDVDILAGVARTVPSHAGSAGDFVNPLAAIKAFKVKGLKGSTERFFAATTISAGAIGTVSLLNADFDAATSGLYALIDGGGIGSVRHLDRAAGTRWSWPVRPGTVFAGPAGLIHLL